MPLISFLTINRKTTTDSQILFFDTEQQGIEKFKELTEPLLAICHSKSLEDGETWCLYEYDRYACFVAGHDGDLDAAINNTTTDYKLQTVYLPHDKTHYVADFAEDMSDTLISFCDRSNANAEYNRTIREELLLANECGYGIVRYDPTTWFNEDNGIMFIETSTETSKEAYFGWANMEAKNTIRMEEIK